MFVEIGIYHQSSLRLEFLIVILLYKYNPLSFNVSQRNKNDHKKNYVKKNDNYRTKKCRISNNSQAHHE